MTIFNWLVKLKLVSSLLYLWLCWGILHTLLLATIQQSISGNIRDQEPERKYMMEVRSGQSSVGRCASHCIAHQSTYRSDITSANQVQGRGSAWDIFVDTEKKTNYMQIFFSCLLLLLSTSSLTLNTHTHTHTNTQFFKIAKNKLYLSHQPPADWVSL